MADVTGPGLGGVGEHVADHGLANEAAFFDEVRNGPFIRLNRKQVEGMQIILAAAYKANWGIGWTANALATAFLETNATMEPVREAYWLSEDWRRKHLRYYPWYGRGYPQVTWERNYRTADEWLASQGLIKAGELLANPDLMMRPEIAAPVMIYFMEHGLFTTKKLGDYIPAGGLGTPEGHKKARQVINGKDRWNDLSDYAMKFQAALQLGGWKHA